MHEPAFSAGLAHAVLEGSRAALAAIRANALRSALTALGIIIGVAAVIAVVAIMQGLSSNIVAQLDDLGSDTVTLRAYTSPEQMMLGAGTEQGPWETLGEVRQRVHRVLCRYAHLDSLIVVTHAVVISAFTGLNRQVEHAETGVFADGPFSQEGEMGDGEADLAVEEVGPGQFHGIEVKPWAREIAELTLWIGYHQFWSANHGGVQPPRARATRHRHPRVARRRARLG